jgi:uncharacterized membrane protein
VRFDSSHYENIQRQLRGVLIVVAQRLQAADAAFVDELVDANELGTALETTIDLLVQTKTLVDDALVLQMEGLAKEMRISSPIVDQLNELRGI